MLSNYLSMEIYKYLGIGTHHPLILVTSKEHATVYAPVNHWRALILAIRRIYECLQLLHEELTGQLVSLVQQIIQSLYGDLISHSLYQVLVQTVHVNWQPHHIMQVLYHEVYALLYQHPHLQEVRGDKDRDHILNIQLRPTLILYLCLFLFQVLHEPLKDLDVTVHTDVYIINRSSLSKVLLKVLHVGD
jgi:hypothetical protein